MGVGRSRPANGVKVGASGFRRRLMVALFGVGDDYLSLLVLLDK